MTPIEGLLSEERKSKVSALIAGVLVIIAGFLVYRNFSKVEKEVTNIESEVSVEAPQEEQDEGVVGEEKEGEVAGAVQEEGAGIGGESKVWQARDVSPNSISGNSYTVVAGDTLWEIAEGRYGSGFDWQKILEANKDKIGFLADGSQALIEVGQALQLPD